MNRAGFLTSTNKAYNIRKAQRKLSSNSQNESTPLDGLAIKSHQMSIAEQLSETFMKQPKGNNILFEKYNFPLINVISKRNVLNNSTRLVKNLLRYNNKVYMKKEENLMLSKKQINNERIEGYSTPKVNKKYLEPSSEDNSSSLSFAQKEEKRRRLKIKNYMRTHDCNFYNREYFLKDPFENYARNAYKVKKIYQANNFMSKIKKDVSSLKFSHRLKFYSDL